MRDRPDPARTRRDAPLPDSLPDALAARLRALPAPDPGDAYFDALPGRVAARLSADAPADRPYAPTDRPARPRQHFAPRWARLAAPVACALALLVWWTAERRSSPVPASPEIAQTRPDLRPAPPRPASVLPDTLRRAAPAAEKPDARPLRAPKPLPVRPRSQAVPFAPPRRSHHLAAAPAPAAPSGWTLAAAMQDSADADGVRLLRRAQLVVLALQYAETPDEVAMLAPLAEPLVGELSRWRLHPRADPALVAFAAGLEPVLIGLAALAPEDAAGAQALRTAARRADLSLALDRALIVAGTAPPSGY